MGIFLRDNAVDHINHCCDEEVVRDKEVQRKTDIYKAVCAFVELKQPDVVIYELINDHIETILHCLSVVSMSVVVVVFEN